MGLIRRLRPGVARVAVCTAAAAAVHALPLSPAHAAPATLAASCAGPREATASAAGEARFSQTFAPSVDGTVTSAEADVTKPPGSSGEWTMSILADNIHPIRAGVPSPLGTPYTELLATARIPDSEVPVGESTLHGTFAEPAPVQASGSFDREYDLVVSRPGASAIGVGYRTGNDCAGAMYESASQTGPFGQFADPETDMVYAVFISDVTPPRTRIAHRPRRRTHRRRFALRLRSSEPGSTFECGIDGAALAPCKRRAKVSVKPGRHRFRARATDAAGNVDATPAKFRWKVLR